MKNRMIKLLSITVLATVLMTGCAGETKETEAPQTETTAPTEAAQTEAGQTHGEIITDTTVAGWHIVVEDRIMNKSLENVSVELGYTGVETSNYVKEASEGNVFYLVKLKIEKDGSKEVIDWANMKLKDAEGNEYARVEDEFITDLGMERMSGTSLNFGSNEGWIAFEVKEGATGLQLVYPFEAETFSCDLPK